MTETIKTLLKAVLCCFDFLSVPGYCSMTIMVYLSYGVPFLKALASHGKTRISTDRGLQANKTAIQAFIDSDLFLIGKRRFSLFYYIGIVWLTASIWLAETRHFGSIFARPSIVVLYLHLIRRLYECLFVHKWRPSSRMHIAGFAVGLIHYLWLPSVFVSLPCKDCLSPLFGSLASHDLLKFYDQTTQIDTSDWSPVWIRLPTILFCLWAQCQQHRHHVYLAELRSEESKEKDQYTLPTKGWFGFVTCPHYLAEIAIYLGFALILAQERKSGLRHWVVLIWVASNLTLSAIMNHRWYKKNLPRQAIEGKWAIFPHFV